MLYPMCMRVQVMCAHDQVVDTDYLPQGINCSTSTASSIAMNVRKRVSTYVQWSTWHLYYNTVCTNMQMVVVSGCGCVM